MSKGEIDELIEQAKRKRNGLWALPKWHRVLFEHNFISASLGLSSMFNTRSSTYKYFWALSIAQMINEEDNLIKDEYNYGVSRDNDGNLILNQYEILKRMIANAWYPTMVAKINFPESVGGRSGDHLAIAAKLLSCLDNDLKADFIEGQKKLFSINELIREINHNYNEQLPENEENNEASDSDNKTLKFCVRKLKNNVPKAFLSSFPVNNKPYEIVTVTGHPDQTTLKMNADFVDFFKSYPEVMKTYILDKLAEYLSKYNQLVPNLRSKLEAPNDIERGDLKNYRSLWSAFRAYQDNQQCVSYISGEQINWKRGQPIDHFIPHSFIWGDSIWNLMPLPTNENSGKSNKIIEFNEANKDITERYLEQQWKFYSYIRSEKRNYKLFEEYTEIKIPLNYDSENGDNWKNILKETLTNYSQSALRQGFPEYRRNA